MKCVKSALKTLLPGILAGLLGAAALVHFHSPAPSMAILIQHVQRPSPTAIQQVRACSVNVFGVCGQGSGVIFHQLKKTYVLTAAHVLEGSVFHDTVQVSQGTNKWDALVVNIDVDRDLALLRIDAQNLVGVGSTLFDSYEPLPVGTHLLHVGNTLGVNGSYLEGVLSGVSRFDDQFDQSSIACYPGSSGGGIFLESGELVGILTCGYGVSLNFFIPVRHIRAYLEANDLQWLVR